MQAVRQTRQFYLAYAFAFSGQFNSLIIRTFYYPAFFPNMNNSLPLLALTALLGACSSNASTPPADATASSTAMASTTVGEQFMEANVKEDSVKIRSLLADEVVVLGSSPKERASGKDTVGRLFARGFAITSDFKFTPLSKRGDANLVYYTGFYT
jgi:hypothetical protein